MWSRIDDVSVPILQNYVDYMIYKLPTKESVYQDNTALSVGIHQRNANLSLLRVVAEELSYAIL